MKKWRGGSHGDPAVSNLPLCFGASDGASPRHSTNTPALRETARGTEPGVAVEALNSLRHAVAPLARRADHRRLPRPAVAQGPVPDGYVHVTLPQFPHQLVGQSHVLARLVFLRLPRQEPARTDPVGSVRSACAYRRARPGRGGCLRTFSGLSPVQVLSVAGPCFGYPTQTNRGVMHRPFSVAATGQLRLPSLLRGRHAYGSQRRNTGYYGRRLV